VRVTLDAYPGESFPGHVLRVAPYVLDLEEQNRTFEIEVEFADAEFARTLRPGTSADVEVILDAVDDVLRIPSYALIEGKRVLRFNDGVLESVEVETGLQNWQFTEIRSGLADGDAVVISLDRVEVQAGAAAEITAEAEK
jgi:HlyD family secretion protein